MCGGCNYNFILIILFFFKMLVMYGGIIILRVGVK